MSVVIVQGGTMAAPVALGLAGFGGALALLDLARRGLQALPARTWVLRQAALPRARRLLPPARVQRIALAAALSPRSEPQMLSGPPTRAMVRADILKDLLSCRGATGPGDLSEATLAELSLLIRLLDSGPAQAGDLAQMFRAPAAVLDLRDRLVAAERARALHDRQASALSATQRLWRDDGDGAGPLALDAPDPDLAHRILIGADLAAPGAARIARALLVAPGTDRASVAGTLVRLVTDGTLDRAADDPDQALAWHDTLTKVARMWNAGAHADTGLGLAQADAVVEAATLLPGARRRLARVVGRTAGEDLRGLCRDYDGRAPRPRPAWCLTRLCLVTEPDPADYTGA